MMFRGYLYFIGDVPGDINILDAQSFAEAECDEEGERLGSYYIDFSFPDPIMHLPEYGFTVEQINEDVYRICTTKEAREEYFRKQFLSLKEAVEKLTLSDFASSSMYDLSKLITNNFSDAVHTTYAYGIPFDEWLRDIETEKDYFVSSHTLMIC